MRTCRLGPVRLLAACVLAAAPAPLHAQDFTGEYVFMQGGTEALSLRVDPPRGGQVAGEVSSGGSTLPFRGSVAGGKLSFTTSEGGAVLRWEAVREGAGLALTVVAPDGERERLVLVRRGAGWSGDSPGARQWEQRLTGRAFTMTERTGGGSSGGAVKDVVFTFCPGGRALLEERFALNVSVPGMGGGETSRRSEPARWRVVTSGGSTGVVFTSRDGEQMQIGIRAGSEPDILIVADKPVRLRAAGARCSDPSLRTLPPGR